MKVAELSDHNARGVVPMLEKMLGLAKSGQLVNVAVLGTTRDGQNLCAKFIRPRDVMHMVGLHYLHARTLLDVYRFEPDPEEVCE